MADIPNPVSAVANTAKSRQGLIALIVVVLLVLAYESSTGAVTRLLQKIPVLGKFFIRKAA